MDDDCKARSALFMAARPRVNDAIERLSNEPRERGTTRLAGRNDYRLRVGDWRIVYGVDDERRRVVVIRIAHRSDVHRRL
jgi:mRNA interferase RelE/StbE